MPFISKNEYKIFSWSKVYIITDNQCKERLEKLEQFREFIWEYKPPIIIPIMLVSVLISFGISFFIYNNFEYIEQLVVWLTIAIYILISTAYYIKIKKAIYCNG